MKKIILVDGNNLLFRSYYATSYSGIIMRNKEGFPTNALYGFISMMNKIIAEEQPSYIMVAFDRGKTFRHEQFDWYKDGRKETPEDLKLQFPKAKEVLDTLGIEHFDIDRYEADDIIGTLAKEVDETEDFEAVIISSDKDLLQLISPKVKVKLLKQSGFIWMDKAEFRKSYGVEPIRMIDLKALMGDASDNIPGVKGIGEKTAISLMMKFGSLEQLYDHLEEVTGKTKEKLETDRNNAFMSKEIATIYRSVPIGKSLEELKYRGMDKEKYIEILKELEFHSMLKKMEEDHSGKIAFLEQEEAKKDLKVEVIGDSSGLSLNQDYAFYMECIGGNYHRGDVLGMGIFDGEHRYFITKEALQNNPHLLEDSHRKWTYDLKKHIVLLQRLGGKITNCSFDSMVATYLLNYSVKDDLAFPFAELGYEIATYEDTFGTLKRPKKVSEEELQQLITAKAQMIYETRNRLEEELKQEEETSLFYDIEMPLVEVLADMELTGIAIDQTYLETMGEEIKDKMEEVAKKIFEEAGMEFNIMSPRQLGEVLFDKMGLPYPKRMGNKNYSTSKEILDKLVHVHPIINEILDYRTLSKLYTNYIVGLIAEIHPDGKVHTIFNQTLTRTGRLSSVSPNLQNIPARLEYGRLIRKAFLPSEGSVLISSDYSQIELRMFASLSKVSSLIDAFVLEKDIHRKTASDIFHVTEEEVTKEMRRTAKAVNFGILYGISTFGLSEDLGIDVKSAKEFMDTYLKTYPGIKEYMDQEIKEAYEKGYVRTIMNRKRTIEELQSKNYMVRSQGERIALNTPIQGSAADILKKAMVDIYEVFSKRGLKSKMLIQVHDELVIDCPMEEQEEVIEIVRDIMEHVVSLDAPLKVEIATGTDWYEAK